MALSDPNVACHRLHGQSSNSVFGLTVFSQPAPLNKATCPVLTTMATYGFLVQHPKTKASRTSIIAAGNAAFARNLPDPPWRHWKTTWIRL